uniref:histidine kinase n=1 Tax=Eiseniibacteriota bacterium TaxID=2212470 RepID=A0A832MNL0_UNCEI
MTTFEPPPWTRPTSASARTDAAARPAGAATSFLLSHGAASRHESRRVAVGLGALALVSVVLLNAGILQSAREHLERQRWGELADHTEVKREEVREVLWQFERHARFIAEQEAIRARAARAAEGPLPEADRRALEDELRRAAEAFSFRAVHLVGADGRTLAAAGDDGQVGAHDRDLAKRVSASERVVFDDVRTEHGAVQMLSVGVPVATGAAAPGPVLVFHSSVEDVLLPLLMTWPGFGSSAGAYLVRRAGDDVVFLTSPPASLGLAAGQRLPSSSPVAHAADIASAGVESSVESQDRDGRPLWTVTRALPEFGWGLVGQVDRSAMLAPLRGTMVGLLALDLAMLLLGLGSVWFWRRQYVTGLARREVEVTRKHAARVQSIFDTAFDAILTFDRQGRVATANRAAEGLLGHEAAALVGQPIQRFLHWGAGAQGTAGALPATGTMSRCEAVRVDGVAIPVELSLGASGEGEELLYTAIVRDIRDRVAAEERIRAFADGLEASNRRLEEMNAQLEEASRLKSEFLANTSHELRTPLNGMIGFLQLVLDGLCDSKEEEREFLQQSLQCSRHLLGLINDVLDIAKIEAGKLSLELEPIDVRRLFDEVYTVTHVQAAQKGIKLLFDAGDHGDLRVRGDFNKTKQVLINLVGNSLKFTPSGTITVRARAHADQGHFLFEVVDTGIGIEPSRQKLIFEKFTQADGSTTRKYGGTGLGLAISRSLVELMGGIIGVHSEGEGRGTRMYFSLPVWRTAGEEHGPVTEEPGDRIEGPAGGALVLIVEDDAAFRRYLATLLHAHGYRTVEARHAEGGWVLARRLEPAVVVLDYALACPEGASIRTGWDLAERMTGDAKTRHIPVVFVTGFDEELKDKLRTTAFARKPEHLMKPIDGGALLEKIQALVGPVGNRPVRVLMADDDAAVSAYVRKVLPADRFHVEVAANGEECLHALRTQPRGFDLLLLDLMMPEVSGYEVLREMALTGTGADLPVLVLTNFPEGRNEEERRLLDQGLVLDVLPKSAVHDNPQLLAHVIDWHLQLAAEGADGARAADEGEPEARAA